MQFYAENDVFNDFYVNKYGNLPVYGAVSVLAARGLIWLPGDQ